MKKNTLILSALVFTTLACQNSEKPRADVNLQYPHTEKDSTAVNEYFGKKVPDPYRWLEDDRSEETAQWVKQQNEVTFDYLQGIPYRDSLKDRLTELMDYEKVSAPRLRGDYFYFYKNKGLQDQSVLYRYPKDKTTEEASVFLDPNQFSEDGTISLAGVSFTKDGKLAAYQISEGGSDWRKVVVIDAESKRRIEDTLVDVKFSGISWRGNEGFYYSSYDKPEGSELSAKTDQHRLYFHKLGQAQDRDELIFGDSETPRRYVGGFVTEDQDYLVITAAESTTGNELYLKDLSQPESPIVRVVDNFEHDHSIIYSQEGQLFIKTDLGAPNGRVVVVNADSPKPENWKDLIPESEHALSTGTAGGKIFATYTIDAINRVYQYDLEGNREREIELPGLGSAGGFSGRKEDSVLHYSFTSYVYPSTIFEYDISSGQSELYRKSQVDFKPEDYKSHQVFYRSKDGTKIPMIITHKKGLDLDGNNPTLLYGYGGFNISLTPSFSTSKVVLLEQGGIYAVANLRGGGEYGQEWHRAGMKMNKQNVFDDFIAAAEFLIDTNYTSPDKLGISGRSNGGLLVGATMTQRPDLTAVALPGVGVLDMLRYHKFTAGAGWKSDYGTADESREMFEYLLGYSPLHNLEEGTDYPATMITTGDHDDRVVPAHSFKFAAALQEAHAGRAPVLIRIETDAGHGAGKPTSKVIEEEADQWSFFFKNTGHEYLPKALPTEG